MDHILTPTQTMMRRRVRRNNPNGGGLLDGNDNEGNPQDDALLRMAVNHLLALVVFLYGLYALCRFGLGWTPGSSQPPPTFVVQVNWKALWWNNVVAGGGDGGMMIGDEDQTRPFLIISNTTGLRRPSNTTETEFVVLD